MPAQRLASIHSLTLAATAGRVGGYERERVEAFATDMVTRAYCRTA